MSETRPNSKREKILEEVRETPGKGASEIAESVGCSPAIVGRVVETNADEHLRTMRELRMKKHVDDLYDIERDILWIITHRPDAEQHRLEEAYKESADIGGIQGVHPETGKDAPSTVGCLWRDCIDSGWQGRRMIVNDLREVLDEEEVSDEAKEAVELLDNRDYCKDRLTDMQISLLREIVREPTATNRELERRAGYSSVNGTEALCRRDESLNDRGEQRADAAATLLEEHGYDVPETDEDTDEQTEEQGEKSIDEDDEELECRYCSDTFKNEAGRAKHEKHCDEREDDDETKEKRDEDSLTRLSDIHVETLEAIIENPDAGYDELIEELDTTRGALSSRLHIIRKNTGYELKCRDGWEKDAREILGVEDEDEHESEPEPEVTVEHGGSSTQDVLAEESGDEPDDTPRVKNEDDYVDLTDECMSEHTEREATVPNDTLVDSVLRVDEDIVRRLRHTGAAVAEIDDNLVRLEVA
jgi:hypothetical protein